MVTSLTVTQGIAGSMPVHTAFVYKLMKRLEVYSNWIKRTVLKIVRSPKTWRVGSNPTTSAKYIWRFTQVGEGVTLLT